MNSADVVAERLAALRTVWRASAPIADFTSATAELESLVRDALAPATSVRLRSICARKHKPNYFFFCKPTLLF